MQTFVSGEFTIFAPTNDAFAALSKSTLDALSKDTTALANILKYHVVKGTIHKADASNELTLMTLAGTKIRVNIYPHNNVSVKLIILNELEFINKNILKLRMTLGLLVINPSVWPSVGLSWYRFLDCSQTWYTWISKK